MRKTIAVSLAFGFAVGIGFAATEEIGLFSAADGTLTTRPKSAIAEPSVKVHDTDGVRHIGLIFFEGTAASSNHHTITAETEIDIRKIHICNGSPYTTATNPGGIGIAQDGDVFFITSIRGEKNLEIDFEVPLKLREGDSIYLIMAGDLDENLWLNLVGTIPSGDRLTVM